MNGRERRVVGNTPLAVSRLGIGGGSLANLSGDDGVRTLLNFCWEQGLRYFDTAPLYAAGASEMRFGTGLKGRPRDQFVLSTKLGRFVHEGREAFDYTASGAAGSIEQSLERLGLERIDIVFIHDVTPAIHGDAFERQFAAAMAGAYPYLADLRARGVIGAIGVGMADAEVSLRFARAGQFDCFMLAGGYTLLEHASLDTLLQHCAGSGTSVMVAAPFNTGILATGAVEGARYFYRAAPADVLARTARIEDFCRRHGVRLAAAALQFPLAHPAVVSVVAGHQSPDEVTANLDLLAEPIPPELWQDLKSAHLLPTHAPTPRPGDT